MALPTPQQPVQETAQSQTFQDMAVATASGYLQALAEFEQRNSRVAAAEESMAILLEILQRTYEQVYSAALSQGVEVGGLLAPISLPTSWPTLQSVQEMKEIAELLNDACDALADDSEGYNPLVGRMMTMLDDKGWRRQ